MKLHTYKPPLATRITLTVLLVTLMLFLCGIAFLLSNEITTPSEQGYLSYFNLAVFLVLTSFGFFILQAIGT